jgi:hypothetical protein
MTETKIGKGEAQIEPGDAEEEDHSLKMPPGKILAPDFDALDIRDGVYETQTSPQTNKISNVKLSPIDDQKEENLE